MMDDINNHIKYEPETGKLYWIYGRKKIKENDEVGHVRADGYIRLKYNGKSYYAHKIAWLLYYGYWPQGIVDHINGIKSDNRINNLRNVSQKENCQNRIEHRQGKLLGTHYNKKFNNWQSFITFNGKKKHLGCFDTEQKAHEAYLKALEESNK